MTVALLVTVLGIAYFLLGVERESNRFMNYNEVVESGLIKRGWIPVFIPKSAYNIKEQHRVDVPYIHVELKFTVSDVATFEAACEKVDKISFFCLNSGYPVKATITNGNHANIRSVLNGI